MSKRDEDAPTLRLEVLSLGSGGLLLEGITSLQLKLADGSGWAYAGACSAHSRDNDGLLKYKQDGEEQTVPVKAGIMTLSNNLISILTTH